MKQCKDCGSTTRKLPYQGPRCTTCWRTELERRREHARDRRMCATYGLQPGEWLKLLEAQGFKCAGCDKPFTKTRQPDCDHDHATGYVRGALCKSCNRHVLKWAKDNPTTLRQLADYLENPPAQRILGMRKHEG